MFPKNARASDSGSGARELAQLLRVLELSHDAIRRDIMMTKRDAYYHDVNLFRNQRVVDQLVDDLAATFHLTRGQLHFTASPKGLFQGDLELITANNMVISGKGPPVLIPASDTIKEIRPGSEVQFILIVEKEAVFNSLVGMDVTHDQRFGSSILICGIGYPNLSTRQLVYRLSENTEILKREIPIHILVDCDPHGIDIAKVYKFGSQSMAFHPGLCSNPAELLGVKSSDWKEFNIDPDLLCNMSSHDYDKANQLLKLEILPEHWKNELRIMKETGKKSEIEILHSAKHTTTIPKRNTTMTDAREDEENTERTEDYGAGCNHVGEHGLVSYLLKRLSLPE